MQEHWIEDDTMKHAGRWVKVIAHIRDNATGEIRQYPTSEPIDDGEEQPSTYIWDDGLYGCDCNRLLLFQQANGELEDWGDHCGSDKYAVNLENPATGRIYYREYDERASVSLYFL